MSAPLQGIGGLGLGLPVAHSYLPQPKPARAFGDRVSFETGVCYLGGLVGGGVYGLGSGLYEAKKQGYSGKLFANQVINQCGKYGGNTANTFGVFALTYSLSRDAMRYWGRDGVDDSQNEAFGAIVAGTMQGFARFSRGPALMIGGILGSLMWTFCEESGEGVKELAPFEKL